MTDTRDYYNILGLDKGCSETEIKKSYKQLAMKYHPDKNQTDEGMKRFQEISDAYVALSDKKLRAIYDQYGLEGLKDIDDDGNNKSLFLSIFFC
jgi:DnaJ-class molecular chaperone